MSYVTLEVEIIQGKVVPKEPEKLPEEGKALLTLLGQESNQSAGAKKTRKRVQLPLIRGDGIHLINPSREEIDASLWD